MSVRHPHRPGVSRAIRFKRTLQVELLEPRAYPGGLLFDAPDIFWVLERIATGLDNVPPSPKQLAFPALVMGQPASQSASPSDHFEIGPKSFQRELSRPVASSSGLSEPSTSVATEIRDLILAIAFAVPVSPEVPSHIDGYNEGGGLLDAHHIESEDLAALFRAHGLVPADTTHHVSWRPMCTTWSEVGTPGATITYFIHKDAAISHGTAPPMEDGMAEMIRTGISYWNPVNVNFELGEVDTDTAANIHVHLAETTPAGSHDAGYMYPYPLPDTAAPFSELFPDGHHWHRWTQQQTISFTTGWAWGDGSQFTLDVRSYAMHESGHALGLAHTPQNPDGSDPDDVMKTNLNYGDQIHYASQVNIEDLQHLYTNFYMCPPCPVPPIVPPPCAGS